MNKLIRRLFEILRAPYDRYRRKRFAKIIFPVIKTMPVFDLKEILSVQCMQPDTKPFYMEYADKSNPKIGQIFHEDKHPGRGGCCRESWSKIWTPEGWVEEKVSVAAFNAAFEKYSPMYTSWLNGERERWNKEHGITAEEQSHVFPMTIVCDSGKSYGC